MPSTKRNHLVLRIALPFALLIIFSMGALSLYLTNFIQSSYQNILEDNLTSETRLVADRMAGFFSQGANATEINQQAAYYGDTLGVRVTIVDPVGNVLGESATEFEEMENHLDRPEIQRALNNQPATEIRYSDTIQTQMLYAASPILADGRVIGVARLAISLRAIQRNVSTLRGSILIAMGTTTVLTILLGILVALYTVRPLTKLTRIAQRVADGQIEEIGPSSRHDEIGQLHQSIQLMAGHLKAQINDLRAERTKLEAVLSNMTDGVIMVDSQGLVQLANRAAIDLFQVEEGQSIGKSLIEVVRSHQLVDLWRRCQQSKAQETTTLETTPARLFIQGIATPLENPLPGMTLLVFQDLTRVRKLETVRRDFVSNVSHELRTPLASLKALAETLQEGALEDPTAARRFLTRMDTEIDNLTQMVHELLELSRIESGKVPLQRIPVSPCDLATPAVERMQLQADRAGLTLSMDCPQNLPLVKADPSRIEQVVVNLIHNAIKFTQPGGSISITATVRQTEVVFSIQDTGAGIPPDVLPRIFERFYKVDRARSSGGTGLGLSIARHIIEAHGGKIWAESTPEQGSTFFFSLPMQ